MRIEFLKMQGLGNDFLVFDAPSSVPPSRFDADLLRALADRHRGVGFDQALMLEPPRDSRHRTFYRVFNSDGSEVQQCGNGARCVAALLYERAPQSGREFVMSCLGGDVHARVHDDGAVSVNMGIPNFDPQSLPMRATRESPVYSIEVDGVVHEIGAVSIGNPHAVLNVADVRAAPVVELGPRIETHSYFPEGTNVGFMQILNPIHISLRVFERGVGETLACGTGACAAVVVGRRWGLLNEAVDVDLPGGTATVSWAGPGQPVWLKGPATKVFTGSVDLMRFTGAQR